MQRIQSTPGWKLRPDSHKMQLRPEEEDELGLSLVGCGYKATYRPHHHIPVLRTLSPPHLEFSYGVCAPLPPSAPLSLTALLIASMLQAQTSLSSNTGVMTCVVYTRDVCDHWHDAGFLNAQMRLRMGALRRCLRRLSFARCARLLAELQGQASTRCAGKPSILPAANAACPSAGDNGVGPDSQGRSSCAASQVRPQDSQHQQTRSTVSHLMSGPNCRHVSRSVYSRSQRCLTIVVRIVKAALHRATVMKLRAMRCKLQGLHRAIVQAMASGWHKAHQA